LAAPGTPEKESPRRGAGASFEGEKRSFCGAGGEPPFGHIPGEGGLTGRLEGEAVSRCLER